MDENASQRGRKGKKKRRKSGTNPRANKVLSIDVLNTDGSIYDEMLPADCSNLHIHVRLVDKVDSLELDSGWTPRFKIQENRPAAGCSILPIWNTKFIFEMPSERKARRDVWLVFILYNSRPDQKPVQIVAWTFTLISRMLTDCHIRKLRLIPPPSGLIWISHSDVINVPTLVSWIDSVNLRGKSLKYTSTRLHVSIIFQTSFSCPALNVDKTPMAGPVVEDHLSHLRLQVINRLMGIVVKFPDNLCQLTTLLDPQWRHVQNFELDSESSAKISAVSFSPCGLCLAVAIGSTIVIYTVPIDSAIKIAAKLAGHTGHIYSLAWSTGFDEVDNNFAWCRLASCSSDRSCLVWTLDEIFSQSPFLSSKAKQQIYPLHSATKMRLHHPSFVYTAKIASIEQQSFHVITGGHDKVIRVWSVGRHTNSAELVQEIVQHIAPITSLTNILKTEKSLMFASADSNGQINMWHLERSSEESNQIELVRGKIHQITELQGLDINSLDLHPKGRRLIVQSKSKLHPLTMIDCQSSAIVANLRQPGREEMISFASFCPCGNSVLSASNSIRVYDTISAKLKMRTELNCHAPEELRLAIHPYYQLVVVFDKSANMYLISKVSPKA